MQYEAISTKGLRVIFMGNSITNLSQLRNSSQSVFQGVYMYIHYLASSLCKLHLTLTVRCKWLNYEVLTTNTTFLLHSTLLVQLRLSWLQLYQQCIVDYEFCNKANIIIMVTL